MTRDATAEIPRSRLLSTRQVQDILGISKTTMFQYLKRKKDPLPSIKFGKFRRFSLDQLNWWIEKHAS